MKFPVLSFTAVLMLAACGQSGDLYLPERERPRQEAQASPGPTPGDEQPEAQQREGRPDEGVEAPRSPADPTSTPLESP